MRRSESMEMYLETILLLENEHGHAHVNDIALRMQVTKPSVTKAMKQLQKDELIHREVYGAISLTEQGKAISLKIVDRHDVITSFLEASLGLSPVDAAENACRMEHVITDGMMEAIAGYLGKGAEQTKKQV